jgi:nicotinamide riboside kinase
VAFEEPLRLWVDEKGSPPGRAAQHALLGRQQQAEASAEQQAGSLGLSWVLCDSAPLVTAVYSEIYYDDQGLYELALAHHAQSYQATLVCDADLPWEADPGQRDGPALRETTHALLLQRLQDHGLGYFIVQGQGPDRARLAQYFLAGVDFAHR